jgi:hypothetical protein
VTVSDLPAGATRYYDPNEVEAYIRDATTAIGMLQARLQEAVHRAEEAERKLADYKPETLGLGRALLLASDVADKTIADADGRVAEIMRVAQRQAAELIDNANAEALRVVDDARSVAADLIQQGYARLSAAVSSFVGSSQLLQAELSAIVDEARSPNGAGPKARPETPAGTGAVGPRDQPAQSDQSDAAETPSSAAPREHPVRVAPFFPPPLQNGRAAGDRA